MYQLIFIKFLQINQNNLNILSEIDNLSLIYKFNIKKFINNINGALIEIYNNNLLFLQKNTNIIIVFQDDFHLNKELTQYLLYRKNKK